ncbi:trypsin-like serine protease [Corynebacterium macginleyi]|nr:trypsin-like serine protease [Corynebacterium macginleyi]
MTVTAPLFPGPTISKRYTTLVDATEKSRSCSGDSGGPLFSGDEIYAVHSAGEKNPDCEGKASSTMWHSDVTSLKTIIEQKIYDESIVPDTHLDSSRLENSFSS